MSNSCWSSPGSRWAAEVKPCLRALREARALPSGVLGPVDFWALARLAASRASETRRSWCLLVMRPPRLKNLREAGKPSSYLDPIRRAAGNWQF